MDFGNMGPGMRPNMGPGGFNMGPGGPGMNPNMMHGMGPGGPRMHMGPGGPGMMDPGMMSGQGGMIGPSAMGAMMGDQRGPISSNGPMGMAQYEPPSMGGPQMNSGPNGPMFGPNGPMYMQNSSECDMMSNPMMNGPNDMGPNGPMGPYDPMTPPCSMSGPMNSPMQPSSTPGSMTINAGPGSGGSLGSAYGSAPGTPVGPLSSGPSMPPKQNGHGANRPHSAGPPSSRAMSSGPQDPNYFVSMGPSSHPSMMGGGLNPNEKVYPPGQSMVFNPDNPSAPPIYPCGICRKEVHESDQVSWQLLRENKTL